MDYSAIVALAHSLGIYSPTVAMLEDYASLSDGCSGGLSKLYALGDKEISCHRCCVAHDFLYGWGGGKADRKKADKLLRICAAKSGKAEVGKIKKAWRWLRSWIIWTAVRLFGRSHFSFTVAA